jgi:fucose permease
MNSKKIKFISTLPVFMSFIVMGFVDLVGIITAYVKKDFNLNDNIAQLIPLMVFVWFFLLSVPTGILQDRMGKKKMVNAGMFLTAIGMLIPLISYSFSFMLTAVVFLGIGNTVVQVSASPLLHDVTPEKKYASYMSLSQFIKSICSLAGPIVITFVALSFGNWRLALTIYALLSLFSILWLYFTPIQESKNSEKPANFKSCFGLLKNRYILIMVLGIFLTVGTEVSMNTHIINYLGSVFQLSMESAALGISIFFTAQMIGRFSGAVLLNWIRPGSFLPLTALGAFLSVSLMIFAPSLWIARLAIFAVGLFTANLFPLIFALAVARLPQRVNEISGLMIMAVSGGAVIPPLIGLVNTTSGIISGLMLLLFNMGYISLSSVYLHFSVKKRAALSKV